MGTKHEAPPRESLNRVSPETALERRRAELGIENRSARNSEPAEISIIDERALEQRAKTLTNRAIQVINKAPVAVKLLTGELLIAWVTHPHMSMIRGGLVLLGASMAWDHWRRKHPAKPSTGSSEDQ